MRGGFAALAALGAAIGFTVAAPAMAQTIPLKPGESVVIHVDASDGYTIVSRTPAKLSPYDQAVIREIGKGSYADAPTESASNAKVNDEMPEPPPIVEGQIRITLVAIPGSQNLLIIENGYNRAMSYQARLTVGDRRGLANVCLVKPVRGAYEHWPFKVENTEIFNIRMSDWAPGDPQPCQE